MIARSVIAVVAALLLAIQVVRNSAVALLAQSRPEAAARFWPGHPATDISLAMTAIARAAHDRRPVPASAFSMIAQAAARDPLAPEPYLVRGVQAQLSGRGMLAQRAFEAAQWRNPRSLPAAYFLADRYFRSGEVGQGLNEIAALARLSPNGDATIGPYLAAYARNPANWPALRGMLRAHPDLADPTLVALASDIATAPAALALADPREKAAQSQWMPPLLNTLVNAEQYDKARSVWLKATGAPANELIHDRTFSDKAAPPPFNWILVPSAVGLAERQAGGRLHILFYGQEDGILASQLLMLRPGSYRLSLQLLGDPARARILSWSVWCGKASAPIASITLDSAVHGWTFNVPQDCPAQWLRLSGTSGDLPQQVDVTIAALDLQRIAGRA